MIKCDGCDSTEDVILVDDGFGDFDWMCANCRHFQDTLIDMFGCVEDFREAASPGGQIWEPLTTREQELADSQSANKDSAQ